MDYSKCYQEKKITKTTMHEAPSDSIMPNLTYDEFCKIVCEERIEKFNNIKEVIEKEQHVIICDLQTMGKLPTKI